MNIKKEKGNINNTYQVGNILASIHQEPANVYIYYVDMNKKLNSTEKVIVNILWSIQASRNDFIPYGMMMGGQ